MPTFSSIGRVVDTAGLRDDAEGFPAGHYRGHGNRQDHTGPSGPWLDPEASRFMVPPRSRREAREAAARASGTRDATGRGPKGYVRSDERIREDVCEVLQDHGDLDVSEIEVEVSDADVTLRGNVRSRFARYYAEDLAAGVRGVRDVFNGLRILRYPDGQELGGPTSDTGGSAITGTSAPRGVRTPPGLGPAPGRHDTSRFGRPSR